MPKPVTDQLLHSLGFSDESPRHDATPQEITRWTTFNRLAAWEAMLARMAAGWPPDGWYPATYYWEGMELRDELAALGPTLPDALREPFDAALAEVERRFTQQTTDDGGAALAAEYGQTPPQSPDRWWWRRISHPLPWTTQPARGQ